MRGFHQRDSQWMRRERVRGRRHPQRLVVPADELGVAGGERPGLVEGNDGDPAEALEHRAALHDDPRRAALAIPETKATGVARISGQGVATTSTERAALGPPVISQPAPATASVTGRKIVAARSARRIVGARSASADSTRRTISA